MLLLMLQLGQDAELGKLISTMARVQGLSANRLSVLCGVQKSALLRFCKVQAGGYLSVNAKERVLKELGWEKRSLSRRRVHVWQIGEIDDAQYLFEHVLQGRATLSILQASGTSARVAVGVADDVPFIAFATYDVPASMVDPMVANSTGAYEPATGFLADSRVLEQAKQSPAAFFKAFRSKSERTVSVSEPPTAESHPAKQLQDLGFEDDEINDLVEDFLSMKCRTDPDSMRMRLGKQWQARVLVNASRTEPVLESALRDAIDRHVADMAERPLKLQWVR